MQVTNYSVNQWMKQAVQFDVLEGGVVNGDTDWNYQQVTSPFHRLYYVRSGTLYVSDAKVMTKLQAGEMYFIRSNTRMDYYCHNRFTMFYLHFRLPWIGGQDMLDTCDPLVKVQPFPDEILLHGFFVGRSTIQRYIDTQNVLFHVLYQLNNQFDTTLKRMSKHAGMFNDLINHMEQTLTVQLSVGQMAHYCGQSVSDFTHKFKRSTGYSPKTYLHRMILDQAKLRLSTSYDSITEIAQQLGYNDSLYFSRFFKQSTGMSPREYRRRQMGLSIT